MQRKKSILPILSKLLEKFIQNNLIEFLNKYDVLHQSQSGFCSGHSTETALTLIAERWLKAVNDGNIVGTIMVDFRKAFDLVDHSLLIKKLGVYKCRSILLRSWILTFVNELRLYQLLENFPGYVILSVVFLRDLC